MIYNITVFNEFDELHCFNEKSMGKKTVLFYQNIWNHKYLVIMIQVFTQSF